MIKNLFIESYLHDLRVTSILNKASELGCEDCTDFVVWADLLKNIPFTFDNGETWTISKVEFIRVEFHGKHTLKEYYEDHIKIHFKSSEKKRCTYFSLTESKNGKRVVDLFQERFLDEWHNRIKDEKIMLNTIESFLMEDEEK